MNYVQVSPYFLRMSPVAVARWWHWNTLRTSGFVDHVMFSNIMSLISQVGCMAQWLTRRKQWIAGRAIYVYNCLFADSK